MNSVFSEFLNKNVKALYNDGGQLKTARGNLIMADGTFVKINGRLGTIVINEKNIEKMALHK